MLALRTVTYCTENEETPNRAKAEGKTLGRPATLSERQKQAVRDELAAGVSVSALARKLGTSRQTVMRARAADS